MTKIKSFFLATLVLTILNLFIVYTTLFTNLYNNTLFSLWYWPGAIILFITLIINVISIYFGKQLIILVLLLVLNVVMLVMFTAPIILA